MSDRDGDRGFRGGREEEGRHAGRGSDGDGSGVSPAACVYTSLQPSFGSYARSIVDGRARIRKYLRSDLFSDPAFDIVLDLYASEEEGRKSSMGSVARAARIPRTTGLRYVAALEKEGFVERRPDPLDMRRVLLRLSRSAKAAMDSYLDEISSIPLRR